MSLKRVIGAAVGAALFIIFFAAVAGKLINPVSAAERTTVSVSVP